MPREPGQSSERARDDLLPREDETLSAEQPPDRLADRRVRPGDDESGAPESAPSSAPANDNKLRDQTLQGPRTAPSTDAIALASAIGSLPILNGLLKSTKGVFAKRFETYKNKSVGTHNCQTIT